MANLGFSSILEKYTPKKVCLYPENAPLIPNNGPKIFYTLPERFDPLMPLDTWESDQFRLSDRSDPNLAKSNRKPLFPGHYLDQRRLKQPLYRHPWDDISYIMPEQEFHEQPSL